MSKPIDFLSYSEASALFNYDPDSGDITWKMATTNRVSVGTVVGTKTQDGYLHVRLTIDGKRKPMRLHRLAWLLYTGCPPKGCVDHINGVTTDNRWENLRDVPLYLNSRNQSKNKSNKSGVTGVTWHKGNQKWMASIKVHGVTKYLGYFANIEEAAEVRKEAERLYGFTPDHGKRQ